MSEICELADGRRIRFSLSQRKGNPLYFVRFSGPTGRKEISTNEKNKKRAQESALAVIRRAYEENQQNYLTWEDAIDLLKSSTASEGLRPATIDRYLYGISALRKIFPDSKPGDITPAIAESFKLQRGDKVAARTLEGDLNSLTIVFGKWFRKLKIVEKNPFEEIDPPKTDKAPPRFIEEVELKAFFDYMGEKWFRLPVLFLEVKAAIGCRIGELTTALSADLVDGRIFFRAKRTKGREERACRLPPALYNELREVAGPVYLFEKFPTLLKECHRSKGRKAHVKPFTPARLKRWLQEETKQYFIETKAKRFKIHNLRGLAMSLSRLAGISEDDAAVAFDCTPATMREHYMAFDKSEIADRVFKAIEKRNGGNLVGEAPQETQ